MKKLFLLLAVMLVSIASSATATQLDSLKNLNNLPDGTQFTFGTECYVTRVNGDYVYIMQMVSHGDYYGALVRCDIKKKYDEGEIIPAGWTGTKTTVNGLVQIANASGFATSTGSVYNIDYLSPVVDGYFDVVLNDPNWLNRRMRVKYSKVTQIDKNGCFTVTAQGRDGMVTAKCRNLWNEQFPTDLYGWIDFQAIVSYNNGEVELWPLGIYPRIHKLFLLHTDNDMNDGDQIRLWDPLYIAATLPQQKLIFATDNITWMEWYSDYGAPWQSQWHPDWVALDFSQNDEMFEQVASMKVIKENTLRGEIYGANTNTRLVVEQLPSEECEPEYDGPIFYHYDLADGYTRFYPYGNEIIYVKGRYEVKNGMGYLTSGGANEREIPVKYDYAPWLAGKLLNGDIVELYTVVKRLSEWDIYYSNNWGTPAHGAKSHNGISMDAMPPADDYKNYEFYVLATSKTNAVDNVDAAAQVATVEYINTLGQASPIPHQGLNIVKTTYTNGTTTTAKVMK